MRVTTEPQTSGNTLFSLHGDAPVLSSNQRALFLGLGVGWPVLASPVEVSDGHRALSHTQEGQHLKQLRPRGGLRGARGETLTFAYYP